MLLIVLLMSVVSALLNGSLDCTMSLMGYNIHFTGSEPSIGKDLYLGMPLAFNVAFSGVVFIYIGGLLRKLTERFSVIFKWYVAIPSIILLSVLGYLAFKANNGSEMLIAMSQADYGNYLLFIAVAVLLGMATILIAKLIDNPLLATYGQYTFPIYAFHLTLTFVGLGLMKIGRTVLTMSPDVEAVIIGTITLILSCLIIPLISAIDSNLIGEHK